MAIEVIPKLYLLENMPRKYAIVTVCTIDGKVPYPEPYSTRLREFADLWKANFG